MRNPGAAARSAGSAWVQGARPRTLPVAVVPVVVGTAAAHAGGRTVLGHSLLALVVSLGIQIGTNYANDYSDGKRGTDDVRVGPTRLVAGGLKSPESVKWAAIASFAVAALAGVFLALATTLALLLVGAACIAAGWFYTGGSRPYGYAGLGELFVFVFFGIVAVTGTSYVNLGHLSALAFLASIPVGLLAVALLVVNNLRDIPTDAAVGKRTLAVRMGERGTRLVFTACIAIALCSIFPLAALRPASLIALLAVAFAAGPVLQVLRGATGRELVGVLGLVSRLEIVFGMLLAVGIAL
jgi:1,4-dihydroxy-2-naphthoate octaprenyltransferase